MPCTYAMPHSSGRTLLAMCLKFVVPLNHAARTLVLRSLLCWAPGCLVLSLCWLAGGAMLAMTPFIRASAQQTRTLTRSFIPSWRHAGDGPGLHRPHLNLRMLNIP